MIAKAHGGVGLQHITKGKLEDLLISLPPLAEQHRIVAKVDELMALCDQLEAAKAEREQSRDQLVAGSIQQMNQPADDEEAFREHARFTFNHLPRLTTRPAHIKQLRQTILNLAVRGRLVPQDPNEESALTLLGRIHENSAASKRQGKHENQRIGAQKAPFLCPRGWEWIPVHRLLDPQRDISYGVIKLGPAPKTGGIPTLRCSDVKPGYIDLSAVRKVSEEVESGYVRTRLYGGEILINIRGTLGGVAKVPQELSSFNVAREVAVIPISLELAADFLVYVMLSPYFWNAIQKNLRGIAYKGLNLGTLRDFLIPLPPVAEQHRIVAKVDELMAICDQLEAQLATTEADSSRFLEAVLQEALTPVLEKAA